MKYLQRNGDVLVTPSCQPFYIKEKLKQPRSQGLSSLPTLSLRKDPGSRWSRVSQNLGGSPNVC